MRIALLTRRFDAAGGGTERDLLITAKYLAAAGHKIMIYAAEMRGQSLEFEVKAIAPGPMGRTLRILWFAWRAPRTARDAGNDLVLSFARTVNADLLRSGGGAHISYLRAAARWRGEISARAMWATPYHRAQTFVERQGFRSPDLKRAIAVSNLVRDDLMREFRLAPQKVMTLYNGVDLQRFSPPTDDTARRGVRAQFAIGADVPLVVFVGSGFARKGLGFLLRAWSQVDRAAHLLVVGADRSLISFQKLAMQAGLSERVHFAGLQRDVLPFFRAADAFALPSLFEPFGNVVMEAMASGLPVLPSIQCGASELLPEALAPFVVLDPANTQEIAQKMNALLAEAPRLRAAARAAAESFTWERYGEELIAAISSLG